MENIRRISGVAKLMMDVDLTVMTAFISPFAREGGREMAKELIGPENFIEVFIDIPISIFEQRDPNGIYKKAGEGKLPNFSGSSSAYDRPIHPDIPINANNPKSKGPQFKKS